MWNPPYIFDQSATYTPRYKWWCGNEFAFNQSRNSWTRAKCWFFKKGIFYLIEDLTIFRSRKKVFEEFDQHFLWWIFNSKRNILSLPLSFQLLLGPNLKIKWAAFNFLLTMIFWNNESLKCIPFSFLSLISLWNSFLQDIFCK